MNSNERKTILTRKQFEDAKHNFDDYREYMRLTEKMKNFQEQNFLLFRNFLHSKSELVGLMSIYTKEISKDSEPYKIYMVSGSSKFLHTYVSLYDQLNDYDFYFVSVIGKEILISTVQYTVQYSTYKWIGLNDDEMSLEVQTQTKIFRLNHKFKSGKTTLRIINSPKSLH